MGSDRILSNFGMYDGDAYAAYKDLQKHLCVKYGVNPSYTFSDLSNVKPITNSDFKGQVYGDYSNIRSKFGEIRIHSPKLENYRPSFLSFMGMHRREAYLDGSEVVIGAMHHVHETIHASDEKVANDPGNKSSLYFAMKDIVRKNNPILYEMWYDDDRCEIRCELKAFEAAPGYLAAMFDGQFTERQCKQAVLEALMHKCGMTEQTDYQQTLKYHVKLDKDDTYADVCNKLKDRLNSTLPFGYPFRMDDFPTDVFRNDAICEKFDLSVSPSPWEIVRDKMNEAYDDKNEIECLRIACAVTLMIRPDEAKRYDVIKNNIRMFDVNKLFGDGFVERVEEHEDKVFANNTKRIEKYGGSHSAAGLLPPDRAAMAAEAGVLFDDAVEGIEDDWKNLDGL